MKVKFFFLTFLVLSIISCEKYKEFDHLEVVDNSFSGSISVNEYAGDIDGVYNGINDSGAYTFIWENPSKGVALNVNTLSGNGTIQLF
jgi:hypothetical protein